MGGKKSAFMFRLKKAWKRFSTLLRLNLSLRLARRRASKRPLSFSFNDRMLGLQSCFGDERIEGVYESRPVRRLERASSLSYGNVEDDVDKRSQIFIDNFRRRLWLEKQVSLQLRYCRVNSFGTEDEENSPSSTEL